MRRVAVIGNGGGGKTTLSRRLGRALDIPVYHVDSIQFQAGWRYTPAEECDRILNDIAEGETWLIDGFGSRAAIERRLRTADAVVFVDFPIWTHYWWALKRHVGSWRSPRAELPPGCPEFNLTYTVKLVRTMWRVHKNYVPWFRGLVASLPTTTQLFHLRTAREMNRFAAHYCP